MQYKNAWGRALKVMKGRYGDLWAGMLVHLALRLIALTPLLALTAPEGSPVKYVAALTPVMYLFVILPLRFSMAEAVGDYMEGKPFCTMRLLSFKRYGQKWVAGLYQALRMLPWMLPLIALVAYGRAMLTGEGDMDVFSLLRAILAVARQFGGELKEGLIGIGAILLVCVLIMLWGLCRNSSYRYVWASAPFSATQAGKKAAKALKGARWRQLGTGLLGVLPLLPAFLAVGYMGYSYVLPYANSFFSTWPAIGLSFWLPMAVIVFNYVCVLPLKRLLTASFTSQRLEQSLGVSAPDTHAAG